MSTPAERARTRREELAAYIMARPGEMLTYYDVASVFGRLPDKTFTHDMDVIREWALAADAIITSATWDKEASRCTFSYQPAGREEGKTIRPLSARSKSIRSQLVKNARRAEYTVKYAIREDDRAIARVNVRMAKIVAELIDAGDEAAQAIREAARK